MLIGEYLSSVTAGSRVSIPKNFRTHFSKTQLILTRGYEGSLILVTSAQFENLTKDVLDQPFILGDARETTRFLLGGAHEVFPDSQGRIVIPESLYKYANVENEVVFVGLGGWVEIWNSNAWRKHVKMLSQKASQIATRLAKLPKP